MNTDNKLVDGLKELYERNHDAHMGFKKAAESVVSPNLKAFFNDKKKQRGNFEKEIAIELNKYGCVVDDEGSFTGKVHRFWIDLVSTFTGRDEESILDACEDGEEKVIDSYKEFLAMDHMPYALREKIKAQMMQIKETKREIDVLEEEYDS